MSVKHFQVFVCFFIYVNTLRKQGHFTVFSGSGRGLTGNLIDYESRGLFKWPTALLTNHEKSFGTEEVLFLRMLKMLRSIEHSNVSSERERACRSFRMKYSSVQMKPEITDTGRAEQTCWLNHPRWLPSIKFTVNHIMWTPLKVGNHYNVSNLVLLLLFSHLWSYNLV